MLASLHRPTDRSLHRLTASTKGFGSLASAHFLGSLHRFTASALLGSLHRSLHPSACLRPARFSPESSPWAVCTNSSRVRRRSDEFTTNRHGLGCVIHFWADKLEAKGDALFTGTGLDSQVVSILEGGSTGAVLCDSSHDARACATAHEPGYTLTCCRVQAGGSFRDHR